MNFHLRNFSIYNIEEYRRRGVLEKQLRFWDWDYGSKKIGIQKSPNSLKSNNLRKLCGFIFSVSTLPIIPKTLQNHSFLVFPKTQNSLVFDFKIDRTMLKYIKIKKYLLLKNASKSEITEIISRFRAGKSRKWVSAICFESFSSRLFSQLEIFIFLTGIFYFPN